MLAHHPTHFCDWYDRTYCHVCDLDTLHYGQSYQGKAWTICGLCGNLGTLEDDD